MSGSNGIAGTIGHGGRVIDVRTGQYLLIHDADSDFAIDLERVACVVGGSKTPADGGVAVPCALVVLAQVNAPPIAITRRSVVDVAKSIGEARAAWLKDRAGIDEEPRRVTSREALEAHAEKLGEGVGALQAGIGEMRQVRDDVVRCVEDLKACAGTMNGRAPAGLAPRDPLGPGTADERFAEAAGVKLADVDQGKTDPDDQAAAEEESEQKRTPPLRGMRRPANPSDN